jgi:hypothetical protein
MKWEDLGIHFEYGSVQWILPISPFGRSNFPKTSKGRCGHLDALTHVEAELLPGCHARCPRAP